MTSFFWAILGIALFLISTVLTRAFYHYAHANDIVDIPNERSSHQEIVPRGAGIVFVSLWLLSISGLFLWGLIPMNVLMVLLPGTFIILVLSYCDDLVGLSAKKRLVVQLVVAMGSVGLLAGLPALQINAIDSVYLGMGGFLLAVLLMVFSINAYNFMDGLDGIAAMEALLIFGVGGALFWVEGYVGMALLCWALVSSVAGFLVWNWPKAIIFMGDSGSCVLGFLVMGVGLVAERFYHIPLMLWLMLYSLFWFDAGITIVRRLLRGENVLVPHRLHVCQRLHRLGFSHLQILVGVLLVNTLIAGIVFWVSQHLAYLLYAFIGIVLMLALGYWVVEKYCPMWGTHE